MIDSLIAVAGFATALTEVNASKVIIARENYLETDFNNDIILVDMLSASPIGRSDGFNGDAESITYTVKYKAVFTLDFYGTQGLDNANKFIARLNSQTAYEFKRDNDIEVFHNTNILNIKQIQGKSNYDRFQVEIMVKYSQQFTEAVLRIDTAEYTIISNN